MDHAAAHVVAPARAVFLDGFGERFRSTQPGTSEQIEVLRLRHALTDVPSFEFALRERMGRLSSFKHTAFGRVRSVERLRDPAPGIALVSDAVPGVRLIDVLKGSERRQFALDINVAGNLIRQIMSAVAMLHANTGGIAHGAIGPERIVVTPKGRVVLVEHVLAGALEELAYTSERSWRELRVANPPAHQSPARIDWRTDVSQVALVALALAIARPLGDDEYPAAIDRLMTSAPAALVSWLKRALALDTRDPFSSAIQAHTELAKVFDDGDAVATSEALEIIVLQVQHNEIEDQRAKAPGSARLPQAVASPAPRPTLVATPEIAKVAEPETVRIVERKSGVALKLAVAITWMRARDWKAASGVAGLVLVLAVGGFVLRGIFGSSISTGKAGVKNSEARTANTDTLGATAQDAKVSERTDSLDVPERGESTPRGIDRRSARETAAAARAASRAASGSDATAVPAVESKQPAPPSPVPEAPKADVKAPTPTADVKADADRSTQPQAVDLPVTTGLRDLNAGQTSLPPAPAIAPPPAPAPGESPARVANKIYRADDPGVVPPAAISQSLPAYPGVVVVSKRTALEVVINESGAVESATMRDHISPAYDKQVLAAVATWRYRPATVNGTPVKFSKVIGITVDKP
jgi:hypothetical protein